jgi:hypothetical protein
LNLENTIQHAFLEVLKNTVWDGVLENELAVQLSILMILAVDGVPFELIANSM